MDVILKVVGYDTMPLFSSKTLLMLNDSWISADDFVRSDVMKAELFCKVTKNLTGPAFAVKAATTAIRLRADLPIAEQIEAQFFSASAGASVSATHAEANAGVTLASGETDSGLSYRVGAGVSTGGGIKDDSVSFKVGGTGLQVGRKVGVSVAGNEVAVDFGKMFSKLF